MMNFQSDNAGFKRPKHSLSPITNEIKQNEDIISKLPDEIVTHILSLLPDADAYRTRILSNRWNHLCFFLPFLHFKMPFTDVDDDDDDDQSVEDVNKFHDFVDRTFALRGDNMPIKRFFLSCSDECHYNRVLDCLRVVVRSKVEILELGFSPARYRFPSDTDRFSLSWDLFMTCNNTLVDLTLKDLTMLAVDDTQILFPCLKRIKLESIKYTGNQSPENLIPACPVLQELFLDGQEFCSDSQTFKISSPSLKRLRIEQCSFGDYEVVIDANKLEYFYIELEESCGNYSLTNPSCLVEAHIDIYNDFDVQLLTSVSSARILTLASDSVFGLSHNEDLNLPVFPNLVKLIVDYRDISEWDTLFVLLNSMPNLQHITISSGYRSSPFKRRWNPPMEAPACLRFMVKEIVILNQDAVQVEDHVTLIRYLLNHSSVLEKLTLNSNNIDREGREKLLNIRRRSKSCGIEFV